MSFAIKTQEQAIWALRKLSKINSTKEESRVTAQREIDRIRAWVTGVEDKAEREAAYFNGLLRDYMNILREEDPKLKTLALPGGKLAFRKQQPEYTYDDAQLLPWVKNNLPDAVIVKESVSKTVVKNYLKETGEVIPGITVEERPDKFSVEVE